LWSVIGGNSLSVNLTSVSVNAGTESVKMGTLLDPCTPKGYSHNVESWKLSPDSFEEKSKYFATLQSKGNFSECRSAALMLLQKGKGY